MAAKLNVSKILADLHYELRLVDEAIAGLECVARKRARRRVSPLKWMAELRRQPKVTRAFAKNSSKRHQHQISLCDISSVPGAVLPEQR